MSSHLILPTLKSYFCGKRKLDPNSSYILRKPEELCAALDKQNITIHYHPKNEREKQKLIEIINFLNQRGKNVTVTEFERIFEDDLLLELANRNLDFKICLRYMLESYQSFKNVEMEYSLSEYQEVIKKVKYFKMRVEELYTTEEEKVLFVIDQLANYIHYPTKKQLDVDPDRDLLSNFYASIGRGEAVCVGYSMALWKILKELNIPCRIILGSVPSVEENNGHAWNQVYINGIWYNVDLTWFSGDKNIEHLLQNDQYFPNHIPYEEDRLEKCSLQYPRERIHFFLETIKNYPNFFAEYEEKEKEERHKIA